jgi:AcrR family transcriptional regulator
VQDTISSQDGGRRERKRAETHARIQAEGMRLFVDNGFEATTLDEVAAAADVSRRTLLNYFGSKEEIVFSAKADFPQMIVAAIENRPADEPLLDMVENTFADLAARHTSPEALALARLIHSTPALSAGDQAKYEKVERLLASALAARKGLPETDIACRVVAATAIGILKMSTKAWLEGNGRTPEAFGHAAFAALREAAG